MIKPSKCLCQLKLSVSDDKHLSDLAHSLLQSRLHDTGLVSVTEK